MRQISLNFVPTAILSRQVAVIREAADHAALIINLLGQPKSPKSIRETLEGLKEADGKPKVPGIFAAVPYCIDLIGGLHRNPARSGRRVLSEKRDPPAESVIRTRRPQAPRESGSAGDSI